VRIAILTSYFFHEVKEIHGRDRIVWGGAERYLIELCRLLQDMGHEVEVFQSLNQSVVQEGVRKKVRSGQINKNLQGINISCLPETDDWNYSTNIQLNMVFNEIAKHYDLRIFFATFLCWPYVPPMSISICHGIFWDYYHHAYRNFNEEGRKEFLRRQLYGFTAPAVCVAVDSNIRKVIAALSPGDEARISIIYNFVDTKKFVPAPKTWEGINVLYPRRLTVLRGCNDFIKASKDLPQYRYLAVGQAADEGLDNSVKQWGEETSNIRFINKPMDEMPEVYQQADIAVVPTIASEGLSLSLLESMSCGLPVVTTPVGGLGDAVIPNYNALIYDPHYGGLGECIDFLAKNEDVRQVMGERNREIAKQCFDISLWRKLWRRLIQGFGG